MQGANHEKNRPFFPLFSVSERAESRSVSKIKGQEEQEGNNRGDVRGKQTSEVRWGAPVAASGPKACGWILL